MAKTNKGRKLFATTATAALVASAIVPVASAAEVNDINSVASYAKDAVQDLVDRGVIEGDAKGNFNPRNSVTRAEAATIFAKALDLESTGSINFSDVKSGAWYYDAIAAAVNNGVFQGQGAGKFNPSGNLTRSEAAVIYVNAFGLEGSDDLSSFKDASAVKAWAKEAIQIAVANGVLKGDDKGNLNPNANITKQDFAVMFARAEAAVVDPAADLKEALETLKTTSEKLAETVTAENVAAAKTAVADAKEAITAVEEALKAAQEAEVVTEEEVKATEEAITAAKAALEKAEKAVASYDESLTTAKVESVSATNLKEVVVKFNVAVDKASAENLGSYNLKLDTLNVAIKSARLQEDGKSVVLTLDATPFLNQEEYALTITKVKTADKTKTISEKDFKFTPVDSALPVVEKVEGLGNKAVKITFSEPVKVNSTVAGTFKIDDKVVSGILSGNGTRTVIIELFNTQTTGKHTLSVNNQVEDFAGYDLVATSKEFDVVEDKAAPTVVEVKDVTLESATVVFSEDVKDAEAIKGSNYYWMNGTTKHAANSTVEKIDGKTFKLTFSGDHKLPAVATDLYVTNIVDYSGNKIADDTKVSISPVIDQTRPEVVSAIFADTNNKLTLTFNKDVNPSSFKVGNVVLKDKDGKAVTKYGYSLTESGSSSRTLTINFSAPLDAGTYTFELTGIQDTTTLKNTVLPIQETLVVEDEAKPSVTSVTGSGNVYYVNFDKAMDISTVASVLNPENYYVKYDQNGVTRTGKLPASTNITPVNGDKGVIITLPSTVTQLSEITVQGVKGANGAYLNGYSAKFALGDPTNPIVNSFTVESVYGTATNKVLVKFNQPVTSIDKSAFTLSAGGTVKDYAIQSDSRLVELTLTGKLSQDAIETISFTTAAAKNLTDNNVVAGLNVDIQDAIAPSILRNSSDDILVGAAPTDGLQVTTVSGNTNVEINFGENITVKNNANLINNIKVHQGNGLELGFNEDYTVATSADNNGLTLNFSSSSYAGVVYITFDNANGNVVDASAVRTSDGAAITTLKVEGFNTRSESAPVTVVTATATEAAALQTLNTKLTTAGSAITTDYSNAGITGVTAGNLASINTAVELAKTTKGSALTKAEVQAAVNAQLAVLALATLNVALGTPGLATEADYTAAGITGVTAANLAATNTAAEAALATKGSALTKAEIQLLVV